MKKKCMFCGEMYTRKKDYSITLWKRRKYCSQKCTQKSRIGKKQTNEAKSKISESKKGSTPWNKGSGYKTILQKKIRSCKKYLQWRTLIYERDDWTCATCNVRGFKLIVHHLKTFATILKENKITSLKEAENCDELWDLNNGITLCRKCHKLTDSYGKNI